MNPYDAPKAPILSTSAQSSREAPSGIFAACKKQAKWILTLSIAFAGFAAAVLWMGFENAAARRLEAEFTVGEPLDDIYTRMWAFWFLSALGVANAVLAFRYYQGLRVFAKDRRITVLHSAMCRMRAFACTFGITLFLAGTSLAALLLWARVASGSS